MWFKHSRSVIWGIFLFHITPPSAKLPGQIKVDNKVQWTIWTNIKPTNWENQAYMSPRLHVPDTHLHPTRSASYHIFANSFRKLFKGGNYSRAETIWGNTVYEIFKLLWIQKRIVAAVYEEIRYACMVSCTKWSKNLKRYLVLDVVCLFKH